MTPAEFLAVVLPSSGLGQYCAVELTKRKEHFYAENIDDLIPKIDAWHAAKCDVFFALATFDTKRGTDNAQYIRSFFIDMDGYASKKEAALALQDFLAATGLDKLGNPWVVDSGGGLHAYWPLRQEIPVAIWKPVAENLKRLCKQNNFNIDMTVTADTARILRVPGTTNYKKKYTTPRPVRIVQEGDLFDLDTFSTVIYEHVEEVFTPRPVAEKIEGTRPNRDPNAAQVKLMENSTTLFEKLRPHCGQIAHYEANAQEDGQEPVWRGLLSWTKVCEDGDEWSAKLSEMHPYSPERMHQKLAEIKGPYPCTKMDSENPGVCAKCPHWGKVTNPLILGRQIQTDNTVKEIPLTVKAIEDTDYDFDTEFNEDFEEEGAKDTAPTVTRPQPPRGYSYGKTGGIYKSLTVEDGDGKKTTKEVQILGYDLFVVDLLKQEADHLVHMAAVRPEGVITLNFPQRSIVSKDETLKWLASQNIVAGGFHQKNLYEYVLACVEQASMERRAIVVPFQCGWQEDMSFVYNNRVFTKDGRETRIPMPGLENINRNTNSKGTLDGWRGVWEVFKAKQMHHTLAFCADSFGSSLMKFTEYEGFMWHIGSRQSGTGKSLTLSAKAGVWGHPVRYRTGKSTSPVAMMQRAGLLNSLPLLIDEITSRSRADMEWAPTFIFDYAEGLGKERMESGSNKERINHSTWAATGTMTSNVQLLDYMAGARTFSSNGELMRMLEWNPTIELKWTAEERSILKGLKQNYGVAGEAWVRWLTKHQDVAKAMLHKVEARLKEVMKFTDLERYWHAGCTTTVAAAILLGPKYANIIELPIEGIIAALKQVVDNARKKFTSNIRTAEDVLNSYTGNNYGGFIIIKANEEKRVLASWGNGETVDKSITRSKVLGRVEHGVLTPGYIDYFIEEQLLKQHCVAMSYGYDDFKEQIGQLFTVHYVKKDMLSRTNGPSMRVNVMHISCKEEVVDESNLSIGVPKAG
jgi:Domain of unknown function (DUF927)